MITATVVTITGVLTLVIGVNAAGPGTIVAASGRAAGSAAADPSSRAAGERPAPDAGAEDRSDRAPGDRRAPGPSAPPTKTATPRLDLAALEERLRETRAIGLFTKLSLKNQVDDLLAQFREYHNGGRSGPLPRLRERFDLLMMKVLSLLQDRDPALARDVASSREALWTLLLDPRTFATGSDRWEGAHMIVTVKPWAVAAAFIAVTGSAASAANPPSVQQDLAAVIALQGQPCGQVVNAVRQGENDYVATCSNGARYRVFVNAEGRVVVQKQ